MTKTNRVRQRPLSTQPFRHTAVYIPPFGGLEAEQTADRRDHYLDYFYSDYILRLPSNTAHVGFADDVPRTLSWIGGREACQHVSVPQSDAQPEPEEAESKPPFGGLVRTPSSLRRA